MPRNNNQPNRRLGQVDNMVRNTQDERQERLNRLLGRNTNEETIQLRNITIEGENLRSNVGDLMSLDTSGYTSQWISTVRAVNDSSLFQLSSSNLQPMRLDGVDLSTMSCRISSDEWATSLSSNPQRYNYIKHYNYVPDKFNFHHTNSDYDEKCVNLYLGVELEIDQGGELDDNAKFIQEYLGENNCYIMHDGSLSKGLEITTHPCGLNYHKSLPYSDLFNALVKMGYKSHDTQTCGLHVHVNRNFFGENPTIQDLCITKVLYLLEKHWDNIKAVARRDSSRYAERFYMKEDESMFNLLSKAKGSGYGNAKYQIVNLLHKNTIEFRLFKGTLKYETFIATLEFVRNLVYLCKNKPLEQIQMVTFEEIIYALNSEYLINYIKERGIKILENVAV